MRGQEEQVHNHTWNAAGVVGGQVCIPLVLIQGCNHTVAADTLNKKHKCNPHHLASLTNAPWFIYRAC